VADEVDGVESRHVLQLQEVDGVALALAEERDQDVGAGDFVAAGALDVDGGALDDALEAGGGLGVAGAIGGQAGEVLVEEFAEVLAQLVEIDAAGAEDGGGVAVVGEAEEKVLQRRIFVPALAGEREGAMQRLL
jgi:hypothetical protein